MSIAQHEWLPTFDLSRYTSPKSPEDRDALISEVREACLQHGFLLVKNHGVPLAAQKKVLGSLNNLFALDKDTKMGMSMKKRVCRRGYEAAGDQHQQDDLLPDSKEAWYVGPEEPDVPQSFAHGPNVWPDLPYDQVRGPVMEYYDEMLKLTRTMWEILILSLGHPASVLDGFLKHHGLYMKLIRYPQHTSTDPRQFGAGAHSDFGGVTCLLQEPGKEALEVWHEGRQEWLPVRADEDIYVINLGDMIQKWTGGEYKATMHRVLNKGKEERLSVATFSHGDMDATSPLNPNEPHAETVEQYVIRRISKQFKLTNDQVTANAAAAVPASA